MGLTLTAPATVRTCWCVFFTGFIARGLEYFYPHNPAVTPSPLHLSQGTRMYERVRRRRYVRETILLQDSTNTCASTPSKTKTIFSVRKKKKRQKQKKEFLKWLCPKTPQRLSGSKRMREIKKKKKLIPREKGKYFFLLNRWSFLFQYPTNENI